ncbi:hypothetical protein V1L54_23765 [Streptomyces sp. TRM 70361]|uniref:hypothetical protein n=1 Tax=Streptomyces sp. TRM 70361 TaxID=3116553 RepID=UPI002E7B4BED|nr:hypothetical protein [Streptomyces sp. TRM 70361]MEE1942381.1 hypothetical protein [Streptomyces sp. TRM 70361]
MLGSHRPDVAGRVRRFIAVAEACRALLAGQEVTLDGPEAYARAARLDAPRPVRDRVPFTFGGGNSALLRWATRHADTVGLSGLGRTLEDGHRHEARWRTEDVDRQVELVERAAAGRENGPVREALVQVVEVTDDAEAAAHRFAEQVGCTVRDVLAAPYAWIGTEEEIAAALAEYERRWGITHYVVREPALDAAERLLARLRRPPAGGSGR